MTERCALIISQRWLARLARSGGVEGFAEGLQGAVVAVVGEEVSDAGEDGDGPFDEPEHGTGTESGVEGEVVQWGEADVDVGVAEVETQVGGVGVDGLLGGVLVGSGVPPEGGPVCGAVLRLVAGVVDFGRVVLGVVIRTPSSASVSGWAGWRSGRGVWVRQAGQGRGARG